MRERSFEMAAGDRLHVVHDPRVAQLAYLKFEQRHADPGAAIMAGHRVHVSAAADAETLDELIAHLELVRDELRAGGRREAAA